ncbi:MAG: type II toxin-antitoxin system VapC family toxin [Moraxellaceae bacterium]|jgi:PIN domain nuclease of toxin-antitoxin system|nr:type II toxin-antitoxin system VapC family toxin [Moraxellaceae bacterium]
MKLLLDTHIFLWLNQEPEKLPAHILELCEDRENTLFLSQVSPWEIQIKHQLGKLKLATPLATMVETQQHENGLQILAITLPHIYALSELENHHNDPFDRLLIAQAKTESMLIITLDSKIKMYSVMTCL